MHSQNITYANTGDTDGVKVIVTEKIPGAWCEDGEDTNNDGTPDTYECTVEKWFWSVISMLWAIIKYFTFLAGLWGVLYLVINGIMYSMWGIDQSMKDEAKKRIVGTIVWLILLFLSGVILNIIAPWIYK